jgi:hypothetical protein
MFDKHYWKTFELSSHQSNSFHSYHADKYDNSLPFKNWKALIHKQEQEQEQQQL